MRRKVPFQDGYHYHDRIQAKILECGDLSPLSVTATRCGGCERADKSAREKAAASCRTPKLRIRVLERQMVGEISFRENL
jgi:hypothetical protein